MSAGLIQECSGLQTHAIFNRRTKHTTHTGETPMNIEQTTTSHNIISPAIAIITGGCNNNDNITMLP